MPGLMTLRPMAAASKARRGTSRLTDKMAEDREYRKPAAHPVTHFRAASSKVHPINMPAHLQSDLQPFRCKQVTDPLPDNVRARLVNGGSDAVDVEIKQVNYSSSGSEHEPSSMCLAAMVHEFMEEVEVGKCGRARCNCESGSCNGGAGGLEDDDTKSSLGGELAEVLQALSPCVTAGENAVLAKVVKAMTAIEEEKCANSGICSRRRVMTQLREIGYNAALCKSRWEHAGSFPGGDYEYIDVVFESSNDGAKQERLIVDIDFQAQFVIARPTYRYESIVQALPPVYVGTSDRLQQILNVMCDAIKSSLKKKSMFLPPWRKPDYIKAKWFSLYKRTTNEAASQPKQPTQTNISSIAVKGKEWDKKFTDAMELEFEIVAGSRPLSKLGMKMNGMDSSSSIRSTTTSNLVSEDQKEPEGVVRGANRLQFLFNNFQAEKVTDPGHDVIWATVNAEWQPPARLPRAVPMRSAGLASILREAGLISVDRSSKRTLGKQGNDIISQDKLPTS